MQIIHGEKVELVAINTGETVLDVLQRQGIAFSAPCGGKGTCGKCLVTVRDADGSSYRELACKTAASDELVIELASVKPMSIIEDGAVGIGGENSEAGETSSILQQDSSQSLGIAIDLGTTTLVARLLDLDSHKVLSSVAQMNPQAVYGADVLSRISAGDNGKLEQMTLMIREAIAAMIKKLLESTSPVPLVPPPVPVAIAGNTVMEHILAGLSPSSIGVSPFEPLSTFGDIHDLPDINRPVWLAPCVSGYVGGDITCGLLALNVHKSAQIQLLIDLGTNGELALGTNGKIYCCATAAGPVFEGANITLGMPAMSGAISAVSQSPKQVSHPSVPSPDLLEFSTIGDVTPIGICGTGLVDAIALMLEAGVIDSTGMMLSSDSPEISEQWSQQLGQINDEPVFYISRQHNIYISQKDVRNFQLAKSAICSGILTLVESAQLKLEQIDKVCIAGGLGNAINPNSAAKSGIIPKELADKTQGVGNTAIEGASLALGNSQAQDELLAIAANSNYIELSTSATFNRYYMDCMYFQ